MDEQPIGLGYASPGTARASGPPAFPAGPFTGGATAVFVDFAVWAGRQTPAAVSEIAIYFVAIAWGQAAALLVAVKLWGRFVEIWWQAELVARPW